MSKPWFLYMTRKAQIRCIAKHTANQHLYFDFAIWTKQFPSFINLKFLVSGHQVWLYSLFEPHREKKGLLPLRKQRRRSASQ